MKNKKLFKIQTQKTIKYKIIKNPFSAIFLKQKILKNNTKKQFKIQVMMINIQIYLYLINNLNNNNLKTLIQSYMLKINNQINFNLEITILTKNKKK